MAGKTQGDYLTGIDIGSTTAKVAICDGSGELLFARYRRHQTETVETVRGILEEALGELGNVPLELTVTGSAGMGAAETFDVPFVQEVVASADFVKKTYPGVRTFIEIGGEDSKIIFFDERFRPDIRMNGSCAGGTGAFIDQMAVLLNAEVADLNDLAEKTTSIYPIASRCGVFAKTDIQALLSRGVSREDIAASVFHAVAIQVISALSRGHDIKSKILFAGGPLTFFPELRKAFVEVLNIDAVNDVVRAIHPELIPAMGAAFAGGANGYVIKIEDLLLLPGNARSRDADTSRLPTLFGTSAERESWQQERWKHEVPRVSLAEVEGKDLFVGIDSGSTTTKIVLIDEERRLVLGSYRPNNGNPMEAVRKGLSELRATFGEAGFSPRIVRSAVTGYGEDLIRAAFNLDDGVVETMAHCRAAQSFVPDVSFVLDIGGQDMKAIYVQDRAVSDIQVNEACSSGCGSFIETFASSLGYTVSDFAELACQKCEPFDLGTRCTVFMNSRVKQALREGATISDISAGLAYSVIKNALHKVLKLRDIDVLGDRIVVQGGTFRNPAVLRALELLLDKEVVRPDIPELMGAYGAALTALGHHLLAPDKDSQFRQFGLPTDSETRVGFTTKETTCSGCENKCRVTVFAFANGNRFFTGNKCERHFHNRSTVQDKGTNLVAEKLQLLFDRPTEPAGTPISTYGIPRCLNTYENYPFWSAFLVECGFKVILSSPSHLKLFEKGAPTVMAENICLPAKLAHGHVLDLVDKGVDRLFCPIVVHEQTEYEDALNSFNCPVVTGYPDVLKSSIAPETKYGIPLDSPAVSFRDIGLLKKQLHLFFKRFGLDYATVSLAVEKGLSAHEEFKHELADRANVVIREARRTVRTIVVLAGRPYHIDPLINHGVPGLLANMGVDVITEDAVPVNGEDSLADVNVLTQWAYTNRLYVAAKWVGKEDHAQLVQLTSFGCGPDAVSTDEVRDILGSAGKIYTLLKMDETSSLGAVRIRLRSLLEAVRENRNRPMFTADVPPKAIRAFVPEGSKRTYIAPYFSPFYSPLTPAAFRSLGYKVDVLPPQDKASIEYGLKNVNNDICYPAVLIVGDVIKAFMSGRYDPANTSVILTQTGGQCRASNYVPLIKKALASAGFGNVPIVTVACGDIHPDLGFAMNDRELAKRMMLGIIFADPLAQMYLATVAREKEAGASKALHAKYLLEMEPGIEDADFRYLLRLLKRAVTEFNNVPILDHPVPKIGVVGEIFAKYNFFANGNIIEWVSSQGVEVVLPTLQSFFTQRFASEDFDQRAYLKRCHIDHIKSKLLDVYVSYHLMQIEWVMRAFRFHREPFNLKELADITGEVVSLANQFGEGWLLTADMIAMLKEGIGNIVCLQPFGCISNHITGKGLERKLKEMFPHLNLLSLDMDAGDSEVNILNRLQFMVMAAREEPEYQEEEEVELVPLQPSFVERFRAADVVLFENKYLDYEVEKWKSWVSGLGLLEKTRKLVNRL